MTTDDPIPARLAALKAMSVNELKAEWQVLYGAAAPNNSRSFLEGRLTTSLSGAVQTTVAGRAKGFVAK